MKLEIEDVHYHIEILNEDKERALVFLHGFTGSSRTWHDIADYFSDYKIILIDLLGHGLTESPVEVERYSMELQLRDLDQLFHLMDLREFALAGYSMGGRVALAYACSYPEKITALVLESASPGLKTGQQRIERKKSDAELAERIVYNGMIAFVNKWEKIPLFKTQENLPEQEKLAVRNDRLSQDPTGLANSLIGMGTGSQESYWKAISELKMPVLLLTGRLDEKFTAIAEEMVSVMPGAVHKEIVAGHALHVEKPAEFATIVGEYLKMNYLGGKS